MVKQEQSRLRAAVRTVARASAPRPDAARRAAKDLQRDVWPAIGAEIRWAFTPPRTWLMGVVANLIFAVGWLVQLLTAGRHQDWVILVGTYFSSWILADVTTTNLLGADHYRVRQAVSDGVPFWRVLLIKNVALLVIVGLPTLLAAMVLTLWMESPQRLAVTIPTVAVPIVSWLGWATCSRCYTRSVSSRCCVGGDSVTTVALFAAGSSRCSCRMRSTTSRIR